MQFGNFPTIHREKVGVSDLSYEKQAKNKLQEAIFLNRNALYYIWQ